MSDSFADLWNTSAPAKPTPQKLGSPSPQLNNNSASRRPQNDVFAMLSSASNPNSRPITPQSRLQQQQKPVQSQPSSFGGGGGDAFSNLLGGTQLDSNGGMANLTMAERAKRAEAERMRQSSMTPPVAKSTTRSAWDGLDSLASGPSSSFQPKSTGLLDDEDWGFSSKSSSAKPATVQKAEPSALDESDDWGLGFSSSTTTTSPPPSSVAAPAPTKSQALWDHLDEFSSAKPSPPARFATPSADFDFGDREDNTGGDDFDLLGDLGKPVDAISSRRVFHPRETPSPAELPPRRKPQQRSSSPPPHRKFTAMGTWDVQAAIDGLLASTGGAEGSSRPSTPPPSNAAPAVSPAARRRPNPEREGRRGSPQQPPPPPQPERTPSSSLQTDILARTSEFGFSLFKNAERAWQQGKERVQKAYEEHVVGEENGAGSGGGGGRSERPAARLANTRTRPKWMQDREDLEEPGPSSGRRRDDSEQLGKAREDDGWGDGGGWKDDDDDEAPPAPAAAPRKAQPSSQPAAKEVDLFSDDAPAKPYVSPFPLTVSRKHAAAAQEKAALGQYGAALGAYTLAVDALPAGHVLLVPLLNLRALARLKEGDFRGVEADAVGVEGIAGVGGLVEGVSVEMGEAVVEAGREKWDEAGRDWERVAGAGWAKQADRDEGVRGAGRCRKMVAGPSEAAPKPPAPKPKPKAPPAVTKFRQEVKAQEEEDLAKHQLKDTVDGKLIAWKGGKETNIRALLASLDTVLWPEIGLQSVGMKDLVTPGQVKIRYVKAIAKLHPDKLNANNSTLEQRMVANGVFGALNEAWNAFK
ncbi:UBA domain-containing protein 7 [Favolaschia claudopus]|uniref:UBA domain-containing protein 7 n=1 Tax=Favolaschia claudopus TaxID=2862362 RepID=A0AAW0D5I1_9AGAR